MVPPEWSAWANNTGAAVLQDTSTALAVVTHQPGQAFKILTETMQRMLGIPKEKLFENTAKRLFYQDKTSTFAGDPNAYSGSAPAGDATRSCRVVFLPTVPADIAKKIVLSLGPAVSGT